MTRGTAILDDTWHRDPGADVRASRRYKDWLATDLAKQGGYAETGGFVVIGGDLAFYTMIFVILACSVLTMLAVRRAVLGYELGGNKLVAQVSLDAHGRGPSVVSKLIRSRGRIMHFYSLPACCFVSLKA